MKINKLMLALAVAASAFTACNKQETTPQVDVTKSLKSVTLNLSNATFTKSATTDKLTTTSDVALNNLQVFFSDGTNLYQAYTSDGTKPAETHFTAIPSDTNAVFHFLPNAVTEVIVVGNMGDKIQLGEVKDKKYATKKAALLDMVNKLQIDDKKTQGASDLKLFGVDSELEITTDIHNNYDKAHNNPVYVAADITLVPAVARFEVVGFEYAQVDETTARKYFTMEVDQINIRNYHTNVVVSDFTGAVATPTGPDQYNKADYEIGDGNVFTYFANTLAANAWYADAVNQTLQGANYTWGQVPATTAAPTSEFSYHIFPESTLEPQFLVKLTGHVGVEGEDGTTAGPDVPLYLMTSDLEGLTSIEAGNIYRMVISFDDNDLEQPEKCIKVEVEVMKWAVNIITPEF